MKNRNENMKKQIRVPTFYVIELCYGIIVDFCFQDRASPVQQYPTD